MRQGEEEGGGGKVEREEGRREGVEGRMVERRGREGKE